MFSVRYELLVYISILRGLEYIHHACTKFTATCFGAYPYLGFEVVPNHLMKIVLPPNTVYVGIKEMYPLLCGNKVTTRCNRGFYCRSYCLLNMFRTPLCPSSGAQEYYTVVAACGISCCKNVKSNFVSFCGICYKVCRMSWGSCVGVLGRFFVV